MSELSARALRRRDGASIQSVVRAWAHELVCMSDTALSPCRGDNDHARRTQATFARDAVRAFRSSADLRPPVHELLCVAAARGQCVNSKHLQQCSSYADRLRVVLEVAGEGLGSVRREANK